MFWRVYLLLLLVAEGVAEGPFDAFNKLMDGVKVHVARLPLGSKGNITNAVLSGVSLEGMDVKTTKKSTQAVDVTLDFTALSFDVAGDFSLKILGEHEGPGSLSGTLDLALGMEFTSSKGDIGTVPPDGVAVSSCRAKFTTFDFNCSHIFSAVMCSLAKTYIKSNLCSLVKDPLTETLKGLVQKASQYIAEHSHTPPVPAPADGEELVKGYNVTNFNGSAALGLAGTVVNKAWGVNGTTGFGIVLNQIIRKLDPKGELFLPLGLSLPLHLSPSIAANATATVINATVTGLDTFTYLNVLDVQANHTLGNKFTLGDLGLHVFVEVAFTTGSAITPSGKPFADVIDLTLNVSDLASNLILVLGMEGAVLNNLPLGPLMGSSLSAILSCLARPLKVLNFTYLFMEIGDMAMQLRSTLLSPPIPSTGGINAVLAELLRAVSVMYNRPVLDMVPDLLEFVRPVLNLGIFYELGKAHPCDASAGEQDTIFDFGKSYLMKATSFLVANVSGDIPSDADINHVVKAVLAEAGATPSGVLTINHTIHGPVLQKTDCTPMAMDFGMLKADVGNFTISGLAAFTAFDALDPVLDHAGSYHEGKHTLRTAMERKGEPLKVYMDVRLTWLGMGSDIVDWFRMGIEIDSLSMAVDLLSALESARFNELKVNELGTTGCMLGAMAPHGVHVDIPSLEVEGVRMRVHCYSCTADTLAEFGRRLETDEASRQLTRGFNSALRGLMRTVNTTQADAEWDRLEENAVCGPAPPPPETKQGSGGELVLILTVAGFTGVVFVFLASWTIYRVCVSLRHVEEENRPLVDDDEDKEDDVMTNDGERGWWYTLRCDESLFSHPVVPRLAQYLIPVCLAMLIALQAISQTRPFQISIELYLMLAGQEKTIDVYDYTTLKFVRDGWNSGLYFLGVMFGLTCAGWVYVKLLTLIWLWFAPPTVISHKMRSTLVEWLDFFSKWSLIDSFLVVILTAAVRCHMEPPDSWAAWTPNLMVVDLKVTTGFGCFGTLLVQAGNLIINQLQVIYNRNVIASLKAEVRAEHIAKMQASRSRSGSKASAWSAPSCRSIATTTWFQDGAEDQRREALRLHMFNHKVFALCASRTDDGSPRATCNLFGRGLVLIILFACIAMLITGSILESFGVRSVGLVKYFIEITPDEGVSRSWNIFEIGLLFFDEGNNHTQKALHAILVGLTWLVCVVIPFLQFAFLLGTWVLPLTLVEQKRAFFIAEVLSSWSALDVYVVAIILTTASVHDLIAFMTGNKNDAIQPKLDTYHDFGFYNTTPTTSQAVGLWEDGLWVLLATSIISNVVFLVLRRANKEAIRDREKGALGRDAKLVGSITPTPQTIPASPEEVVAVPIENDDSSLVNHGESEM